LLLDVVGRWEYNATTEHSGHGPDTRDTTRDPVGSVPRRPCVRCELVEHVEALRPSGPERALLLMAIDEYLAGGRITWDGEGYVFHGTRSRVIPRCTFCVDS